MADILTEKGIKSIALTYTNNDYGKGLAEAIATAFQAKGGTVTINAAHEDGKADYSAEVAALASAGGDLLVVAGYLDQGGKGIIQASLDSGAFTTFGLPGGMVGDSLTAGHRPGARRLLRPGRAVGQPGRGHSDRNGQGRGRAVRRHRRPTRRSLRRRRADHACDAGGRLDRPAASTRTRSSRWRTPPRRARSAGRDRARRCELITAGTRHRLRRRLGRRTDRTGRKRGSLSRSSRSRAASTKPSSSAEPENRLTEANGPAHSPGRCHKNAAGTAAGRRHGRHRGEQHDRRRGSAQAFRRLPRRRRRVDRDHDRVDHRADRTERRRQDHALQRHRRPPAADLGPGLHGRRGHHRPAAARAVPQGPAAHLPDRP